MGEDAMTRRDIADYASEITEQYAPPHLRERAFLRAYLAICEGRDPAEAVRRFVREWENNELQL